MKGENAIIKQINGLKFGALPFFVISICVLFTIILAVFINKSNGTLLPLSIIPLICGLVYEFRILSKSWKVVLVTFLIAYVFSFFAFLPGKHENNYVFNDHLTYWPYIFCFIFILIAISLYDKKLIPELNEGITMLHSIAMAYWIIDMTPKNIHNFFFVCLIVIAPLFIAFSFYNAFSYKPLTSFSRLILSVWSSIVMLVFSIDNIWRVYHYNVVDTTGSWDLILYNFMQYFLLGISSMFIVRNFYMIIGFFPSKEKMFNDDYVDDVDELVELYIERYSDTQVKIKYSIIGFLISTTIFGLNYYFKLMPRTFFIWLSFFIYPLLIAFSKFMVSKYLSKEVSK